MASKTSSLLNHRDLLKQKIISLKALSSVKSQDDRQFIYQLKQARNQKENELISLIGKIKYKAKEAQRIHQDRSVLQATKKTMIDDKKVLMQTNQTLRRQIDSKVIQQTSLFRQTQQLSVKRDGLILSNAEIEMTIDRISRYLSSMQVNIAESLTMISRLQSQNNHLQNHIQMTYEQQQKHIITFKKYVHETEQIKKKILMMQQVLIKMKIARQQVNHEIQGEQQRQIRLNSQLNQISKKTIQFQSNKQELSHQRIRLQQSKQKLSIGQQAGNKEIQDVINHKQNLIASNKALKEALQKMTRQQHIGRLQTLTPLVNKRTMFSTTKSSFR